MARYTPSYRRGPIKSSEPPWRERIPMGLRDGAMRLLTYLSLFAAFRAWNEDWPNAQQPDPPEYRHTLIAIFTLYAVLMLTLQFLLHRLAGAWRQVPHFLNVALGAALMLLGFTNSALFPSPASADMTLEAGIFLTAGGAVGALGEFIWGLITRRKGAVEPEEDLKNPVGWDQAAQSTLARKPPAPPPKIRDISQEK